MKSITVNVVDFGVAVVEPSPDNWRYVRLTLVDEIEGGKMYFDLSSPETQALIKALREVWHEVVD